jgi:hypothetical protein
MPLIFGPSSAPKAMQPFGGKASSSLMHLREILCFLLEHVSIPASVGVSNPTCPNATNRGNMNENMYTLQQKQMVRLYQTFLRLPTREQVLRQKDPEYRQLIHDAFTICRRIPRLQLMGYAV